MTGCRIYRSERPASQVCAPQTAPFCSLANPKSLEIYWKLGEGKALRVGGGRAMSAAIKGVVGFVVSDVYYPCQAQLSSPCTWHAPPPTSPPSGLLVA
ncbi:hypothetical protein PLESTF_001545300 [Pleodorina starrii]|nr:hypothetical protein PLESTF_001545300 [Pleodorina starrii]